MLDHKTVCQKIEQLFPEKGECGKDMNVAWNEENNAYLVEYMENGKPAKTFVEIDGAGLCIEKDHCLDLAFQVNQVR
ncbi:MAG: hypothetical protein ACQEQS_06385 [Thermodesulfobacteriota bacterium]